MEANLNFSARVRGDSLEECIAGIRRAVWLFKAEQGISEQSDVSPETMRAMTGGSIVEQETQEGEVDQAWAQRYYDQAIPPLTAEAVIIIEAEMPEDVLDAIDVLIAGWEAGRLDQGGEEGVAWHAVVADYSINADDDEGEDEDEADEGEGDDQELDAPLPIDHWA